MFSINNKLKIHNHKKNFEKKRFLRLQKKKHQAQMATVITELE